jgi:sulfate adenylyltransferase large subunit
MVKEHMNIVIVGHVDHGKSTLIGRLLYDTNSIPESIVDEVKQVSEELGKEMEFAYLLDSLKEEREQNITIDTTQIFFNTEKRDYVIIDAPGHVEFIKNMITGASQAETAVLIVDAHEGIKDQTKRHSYIIEMLGLKQVVVVVNKMDKVGYSKDMFEKVKNNLIDFLKKINIKPKYVIPISALKGDNIVRNSENMPWYNGITIIDALNSFQVRKSLDDLPLRFPVQDVYDNIIVGKIETGVLHNKEEVFILPHNVKTKVSLIKEWKKNLEKAEAGRSIGIILNDSFNVNRGEVVCSGKLPEVLKEFNANIFWMSEKTFNRNLTLKCATQQVDCKIKINKRIDSSSFDEIDDCTQLKETDIGKVTIKTDKPVVVENFYDIEALGRFVLLEKQEVLGAGIVLLE